jgi:CMP-N-acetylneuraminic acid synthetase
MISARRVIAIIPARGGSKGLPGKSIRPLCGKPLIVWTIEAALRSELVDLVVVSTDSREIADVAHVAGATVPFLRPPELAEDSTPTLAAVEHLLGQLRTEGEEFEYVVLLEPTSPLREDGDIDAMLRRLDDAREEFDSIVSVGEVGEHPSIMKRLTGDTLEPYCPSLELTTRRQDNEPAYFPYGVAYVVKTASLLSERTFYTGRCTYHRIKRYQNYEIDDIYDFLAVESVMRFEWKLT